MAKDMVSHSSLERWIDQDGINVFVYIDRGAGDDLWTLAVEHAGGTEVFGNRFPTDEEALERVHAHPRIGRHGSHHGCRRRE